MLEAPARRAYVWVRRCRRLPAPWNQCDGEPICQSPYSPVLDDYRLIFRGLEQKGLIRATRTSQLEPAQAGEPTPLADAEQEILNPIWIRFRNRLGRICYGFTRAASLEKYGG